MSNYIGMNDHLSKKFNRLQSKIAQTINLREVKSCTNCRWCEVSKVGYSGFEYRCNNFGIDVFECTICDHYTREQEYKEGEQ